MLGAIRVMAVAPALGEDRAVLIEVPLMLGASAWWARRVLRLHAVQRLGSAVVLGGIAFTELMLAELLLSRGLTGRSVEAWLDGMTRGPGLIGLAAQLGFGLMPALVLLARRGVCSSRC
ncbi:MAG: hypothetical protein LKF30_13710 [Sphingobium sp.]|nr:hypothetical protein [Sphingobium sp.]